MKSKKYIYEWLKELQSYDLDSGIDADEILRIETEIEVLECILKG